MAGFSDDCQWWWDGTTWIATSQIVIPDLPPTEHAKELEPRVARFKALDSAALAGSFVDLGPLIFGWLFWYRRAFRTYREWTIEQLHAAAGYLLGPNEPVMAADVGLFAELLIGWTWGGYGVVVTAGHVLVLANDKPLGHPQKVLLAADPRQVQMRLHAGGILNAYPTILISAGGQVWPIRGMNGIIKPEPVIAAWRQAVTARPAVSSA